MALPVFAITLFVSAFLLFLVQPMIGKLVLPKLGGTPQVWNTCMVFFQSVLLLGYAYTHTVSTRLKLRQQLMVHGALLFLPIILLFAFPFYTYVKNWEAPTEGNPIPETLELLAIVVGVPFFVVSTSAPLLQRWFAYSGDPSAKDPYFLYGASNLGSLLSLLLYPAAIEPLTVLSSQTWIWTVGYIALAAMVIYCAYTIYKLAPPDSVLEEQAAAAAAPPPAPAEVLEAAAPVPAPAPAAASTAVKSGPAPGTRGIQRKKGIKVPGKAAEEKAPTTPTIAAPVLTGATAPMTWWRRVRWVLLAAVPSSLMLGVTNYISTDLSPFPLVWVIPLALYLLSFILVYWKPWTGKNVMVFGGHGYTLHHVALYAAHPLGILVLCSIAFGGGFDPFRAIPLVMFGFFASALACHGELAVDRPNPRHLTEYFLLMSVGGALGGTFNGIMAPVVFQAGVTEYYIAIVVACMVRPQYVPTGWFDDLILNAFPGFQGWVRDQGDEMAKSLGRTPPRTTYMFSVFLDVLLGLFVMSITYYLTIKMWPWSGRDAQANLEKFMKFLSIPGTWMEMTAKGIVFLIPGVFCFFFAGRPARMSIAVAGLLVGHMYLAEGDTSDLLEARRTYFGLLRVMTRVENPHDMEELNDFTTEPLIIKGERYPVRFPFTYLMHGTTYHGRNYYSNMNDDLKKYRKDISRLATTYYHRYGPVGIVMEQYNYVTYPGGAVGKNTPNGVGKQNTFYADLRSTVGIMGLLAAPGGDMAGPMGATLHTWSDPPFATIGLGTGTMVSYARPFQHMTYYEIDEVIREFSLPPDGRDAHFKYLQQALKRGVNLEVVMGDARQSLEREPKLFKLMQEGNFDLEKHKEVYPTKFTDAGAKYAAPVATKMPMREKYYKVINVDAFSSDAIPIHLCTYEALKLYMSKLDDDGVLCMHTSNRHMDLVRPVARIALELSKESEAAGGPKINCLVGKDRTEKELYMGHFSSEYVMLYRGDFFNKYVKKLDEKKIALVKDKTMKPLPQANERDPQMGRAPDGWQILNANVEWYDPYTDHGFVKRVGNRFVFEKAPVTARDALWTDDYSYILGVLR